MSANDAEEKMAKPISVAAIIEEESKPPDRLFFLVDIVIMLLHEFLLFLLKHGDGNLLNNALQVVSNKVRFIIETRC